MKTSYDRSTNSLYIELRPLPAARTVELQKDVVLDLGQDGEPVGYDFQHASYKRELIAQLVLEEWPLAVEQEGAAGSS